MKSNKKTIKRIAIVIGVIILPLLYSFFYLDAFWDPYSRLESLPVAIVNTDMGATINGSDRNVGDELCDTLLDDGSLGFTITDQEDALEGTKDGTYYAMILIPEDFSSDIASASSTDKQTATITYSPNQKTNYLASQILNKAVLEIEVSMRESIVQELVSTLTSQLSEIPDQMTELQDGIGQLSDGSSQLSEGAEDLSDGTEEFNTKLSEYATGISSLQTGSYTLVDGIDSLNSGITTLLAGSEQLTASTENLDLLTSGAASLAESAEIFNQSIQSYTSGVSSLIETVNTTSTFLTSYVTANPSLMADTTFATFISSMSSDENTENLTTLTSATAQLQAASEQISAATSQLATGTENLPELQAALIALQDGLSSAKEGSTQLLSGSQTLSSGLDQVVDATSQLEDASTTIANGASDLADGASELNDGISTAQSSVSDSISESNDSLDALEGLDEYAATPITIEEEDIVAVENYGTAFAPYFLSLSLWVGGLMIFVGIFYDPDNKFKILSRESDNKIARSFIYLLIGLGQAVALGVILIFALGLEVANLPLYFLSCCLVSIVFISIIQFLMIHLKDIGKFLSMVLLILQLTSCGGTFPMETVPDFFNALYKYMPMTYSVGLFKQSISGIRTDDLILNISVLAGILIVFMALTIIASILKSKKSESLNTVEITE